MIGILSALEEESQLLRQNLNAKHVTKCGGVTFYAGTLNGVPTVFGRCGVGKVNSAAAAQAMIDKFNVTDLIFIGLAGSLVPQLKPGDVVVSNFVSQHDFDLTAFGKRPGQINDTGRMIEADPKLQQMAARIYEQVVAPTRKGSQVMVGTIVTGDSFIADASRLKWLQREFGAVAAEMEGAAVGHVCNVNRVPFVVIRVISDSASDTAAGEFITFLEDASEVCYRMVTAMLPIIESMRKPVAV